MASWFYSNMQITRIKLRNNSGIFITFGIIWIGFVHQKLHEFDFCVTQMFSGDTPRTTTQTKDTQTL